MFLKKTVERDALDFDRPIFFDNRLGMINFLGLFVISVCFLTAYTLITLSKESYVWGMVDVIIISMYFLGLGYLSHIISFEKSSVLAKLDSEYRRANRTRLSCLVDKRNLLTWQEQPPVDDVTFLSQTMERGQKFRTTIRSSTENIATVQLAVVREDSLWGKICDSETYNMDIDQLVYHFGRDQISSILVGSECPHYDLPWFCRDTYTG